MHNATDTAPANVAGYLARIGGDIVEVSSEHTARLIAEAPDLLEALVNLVSALNGDSLASLDDAEAEALRVIAIARGTPPDP